MFSPSIKLIKKGCDSFDQNLDFVLTEIFGELSSAEVVFLVNGVEMRIIFDPDGVDWKSGNQSGRDHVVLIAKDEIPEEIEERICRQIPRQYTCSGLKRK